MARDGKVSHDWRAGTHLGPNASGAYSQRVCNLGATLPGIRQAGHREVAEVIRSPGQVGYPPSVATDAQLGFPVMAYQSAELLSGRCEGDGNILARLVGARARAQKANNHVDVAQRAKVGFCLCCSKPTHVAAPVRRSVGEYSFYKARCMFLWKEDGSWAARCLAGALYARDSGYLPSTWYWAAQSLVIRASPLFGGFFGTAHADNPAVSAPVSSEAMGRGPKPKINLSTCAPEPSEEADALRLGAAPLGPRPR